MKRFNPDKIQLGKDVEIINKLTFSDIINPIFDLSGTFYIYLKDADENSFKFRDDTVGEDIFIIDTLNKKINTHSNYNLNIGGVVQYTNDPTASTSWNTNSLTNKGYVDSFTYFEQFTPGTINVANTITHNLGSTRVLVQIWDVVTDETIGVDRIKRIDENTLEIYFTANPTGDVEIVIKK